MNITTSWEILKNTPSICSVGSASKSKPRATPTDLAHIRPSPVKFTSQRPDQFPVKPEPERIPQAVADAMKHKMLSLERLKDLPDFVKEDDDDDEVTEITGGNDDPGTIYKIKLKFDRLNIIVF